MKTTSVAKEDAQALVDEFLPFATKMLREHREFLPYGGYITSDGEIVHEGATTGEERSISQDLIDILRAAHRDQALAGSIRASCIVYDLFIARPDQDAKTDAIAFEIDHSDNYSRIIIFPYTIEEDGEVVTDAPFAQSGSHSIFHETGINEEAEQGGDGDAEEAV